MFLYVIIFIVCFLPITIFLPTVVKGRKNIKKLKKQGFILIANHQSGLDIPLLGVKIRRQQHFVAKQELMNNKFVGWLIKNADCYTVERGKPNLAFFKQAQKDIKDGKVLTMFPEGTRKKVSTEEMGELKNGVAMLAIKTKCKILPVYVAKKPKWFVFNKIVIGEPFDFADVEKATHESLALATEKIAAEFSKLKEMCNKKSKK